MVLDPKELENPQVTENNVETWMCEECTLSFNNLDEWKKHRGDEHLEEVDKAETMVGLQT